jgi:hypothetical protein
LIIAEVESRQTFPCRLFDEFENFLLVGHGILFAEVLVDTTSVRLLIIIFSATKTRLSATPVCPHHDHASRRGSIITTIRIIASRPFHTYLKPARHRSAVYLITPTV